MVNTQHCSDPDIICARALTLLGPKKSTAAKLFSLPDDLLLLIISFINVKDILSLRKTSKRLYSLSKLRWVWTDAMKRHVINRGLPVPAVYPALKFLSAEHLEARTIHATKFHENWYSSQPKPRKSVEFQADTYLPDELPEIRRTAVKQIFFLSGRNGEFLITVVGRVVACWEVPLDGTEAYRVAEWVSERTIEQVIVSQDPWNASVLAVLSGDPATNAKVVVSGLGLDTFRGRFVVRQVLRAYRNVVAPLHAMGDGYIMMGDPLHVWYCKSPQAVKQASAVRCHFEAAPQGSNRILAIKVINRYMLVVRENSFQLLDAPIWNKQRTIFQGSKNISACIHMDHSATEAVIVARKSHMPVSEEVEWLPEPVTIISRYSDDGFDVIRQYDLLPARLQDEKCSRDTDGDLLRLPCRFPAVYTRVLRVAPSCCQLQVGPSGKGFWIETRNVTSRHSVYPARCIMGFDVRPRDAVYDGASTEDDQPIKCHCPPAGANILHLCSGALYSRRCDMSEIIWRNYSLTSTALEDTVGRIAVGDKSGRVQVLDFA